MEKISRTDCVRNDVLRGVKFGMNILHTVHKRKTNWIGHILCSNSFPKHVIHVRLWEG